ncbi:MAG TPA: hypothetical protein VFS02_23990 [Telluria sp.]|nr:hypothetical protein [Telluria sp.]
MPMSDMELANAVAYGLRTLTVTDPSGAVAGANADAGGHRVSHQGLMGAILARGAMRDEKSPAAQLELGERTIAAGKGVCTHLAAAVVHRLIACGMARNKIEIMTTNRGHGYGHTFNAINRVGDPGDIDSWGADCIIVDIWMANQQHTSESTTVEAATANFGQGAFYLRNNSGYKDYLSRFGNSKGVVTHF